jgi:hypothetical protein
LYQNSGVCNKKRPAGKGFKASAALAGKIETLAILDT